jgi:hypothetical protein
MQHQSQKLLCTSWPLILCNIMCHDSNLKFWRRQDSLRPCGLHILYIVPMLIIHLSEKHDVGGGNHGVSDGIFISRRGFYMVTKLIFIHSTTNFYTTSMPKKFYASWPLFSMHPIGHHVPWFKYQIYEF